jgi:hypothetical protein
MQDDDLAMLGRLAFRAHELEREFRALPEIQQIAQRETYRARFDRLFQQFNLLRDLDKSKPNYGDSRCSEQQYHASR